MKSAFRVSLVVAIVALAAVSAFAALSDQFVQFGKGPATFLMTSQEQSQWKSITSDADAQAFIDLFWARRDPTAKSPRNEFREQFDQRVQYADEKFAEGRTKGSMTDRGRTLIVLGAPTEPIARRGTTAVPNIGTDTDTQDDAQRPQQIWVFNQPKTETPLGTPTVTLAFVEQSRGEWRLARTRESSDYASVFERVKNALVTQPNITAAEVAQLKAPVPQSKAATPVARVAVTTDLKTPALQAAIDEVKGGKAATKDAQLMYAEFVSPAGDYFVPVELLVGKSAALTAEAGDTIFGVVEDETGKVVSSFEQPYVPFVSAGDLVADKTLELGTGKYTVVMGIAKAGQAVAIASGKLDLTSVAKDATGIGKMILTNDAQELAKAEPVKAPFAFGRLKIVPKVQIGPKDELTYFIEVHNPGIDATTNLPKMQVKLELTGGKRRIDAPLMDANALPLSGVVGPGQYAIIDSIRLAELSKPLEPGEYTLKVKLIDTITKQTYNTESKIKVGS